MRLSVIVPVYNEEKTIDIVIKRLLSLDVDKEIIIINDGSNDNTERKISPYENIENVKVIHLKENCGKGHAIRIGLEKAEGQIIGIQDADLEYNPYDLIYLTEPIKKGFAFVVYGVRFKNKKKTPSWHYLINKFLTFLTNFLYFSHLEDMETCYKIAHRCVWERLNLKSKRFEIEAEITAKILRMGYKIYQLPISYYKRGYREGKKIGFRDGLVTIWVLLKYRFFN